VNNFMAAGGDGFSTFADGTGLLGGAQDIDALVAHLAGFKAPQPPYDPGSPTLARPRIQRVGTVSAGPVCPLGNNVNP
jgi:5'-nucleotidase